VNIAHEESLESRSFAEVPSCCRFSPANLVDLIYPREIRGEPLFAVIVASSSLYSLDEFCVDLSLMTFHLETFNCAS